MTHRQTERSLNQPCWRR